MKVRNGLILSISLLLGLGACASAGGGGGSGGGGGGDGFEPRDNEYTTTSALMLAQAQSAETDSLAEDRYRQALDASLEGIQADSTNPQSYYHAGFALVMLDENADDYARADTLLDTATELYPPYEEEIDPLREQAWVNLYNRAIQPLNAGDLEEAVRLFQLANQLYADRPEAFLNLGAAYAQMGETEQSADAFRDALAVTREQQQQFAQADTVSPEVMESIQENRRIAAQNLGQVLLELNRASEAADVYSGYLEENPDDIQVLSSLAGALSQAEMVDSASTIYENLLSRQGLTSQEYLSVGVGLYQADQFDRAAEAFQQAVDANPQHRDAHFNLAQAYFAGEMWEQAVDAGQNVLELDPRNGNVYRLLARSYAESGDPQTGGDLLEEYEDLSFEIDGFQFQPSATGGATVTAVLTNRTVPQGEPIVLRFYFTGEEGEELGVDEVTIPAPAEGESSQIEARFTSEEVPSGYWYEVAQP